MIEQKKTAIYCKLAKKDNKRIEYEYEKEQVLRYDINNISRLMRCAIDVSCRIDDLKRKWIIGEMMDGFCEENLTTFFSELMDEYKKNYTSMFTLLVGWGSA